MLDSGRKTSQSGDCHEAEILLQGFVGKEVTSLEKSEYQLRVLLGPGTDFIASSPWRLCQNGRILIGSGDFRGANATAEFPNCLTGIKIISAVVSTSWETTFIFEGGYLFEVFPDSVQYELWEAHLDVGWVVFSGGQVTLFPPVPVTVAARPTEVHTYGLAGFNGLSEEVIRAVREMTLEVAEIHSIGISGPSQTGCKQASHSRKTAFDIVELNGLPVSSFGKNNLLTSLVERLEATAATRGFGEVYGPAGVFQHGAQVLVPELQARFTRHLHIAA